MARYRYFIYLLIGSLSAVMHATFHAPMLRPASQAGPVHESAGVEQVS